ncbi:hypothetical protein AB4Y64_05970 [Lysobacter sp. TAF61]|uniref:hypothetical protein n=1 Tax=Lysobacter sp. TAF61 TaxID=3233072 RepID=UPI003F97AE35
MRGISIAALCLLAGTAMAGPKASTETDKAKFIRLTRQLEQRPLSDPGKRIRGWLMRWTVDSPDVMVMVCDLLGPDIGEDAPHAPELMMQMMFGNAAFQIQHPDLKDDPIAPQVAGVRSALAAYASFLAASPQSRIEELDELLEQDRDGELEATLEPVIEEECSDEEGTYSVDVPRPSRALAGTP